MCDKAKTPLRIRFQLSESGVNMGGMARIRSAVRELPLDASWHPESREENHNRPRDSIHEHALKADDSGRTARGALALR